MPDVEVDVPNPANITYSLYAHNLIFDFATIFRFDHESILPPSEFELTDDIYQEFITYLANKDFDYNTQSNEELDDLVTITKREGYYKIAQAEIEALRLKLSSDRDKDLITFQNEIRELLRDEIVSRYYYQEGRIISSLRSDPQLDRTIELLKEPAVVSEILHGTYKTESELALEK